MTYEEIRAELHTVNEAVKALSRPHFPNYGDDRKDEFVADYAAYDEAIRSIYVGAKAKGFIRLFDGRYKLNPKQAAL